MLIQKDNLSRIYQLSRLGLSDKLFITVFLAELHTLLPSYSNSYIWLNNLGRISDYFDERHNLKFGKYFYDRANASLIKELNKWLMSHSDISESRDHEKPALSTIFKKLMLPSGYLNSLFLPVHSPYNDQCIGVLMLHRKQRNQRFNLEEKVVCQSILPFLRYGLKHSASQPLAITDGWQQGLLIIDKDAKLQHASVCGEKLLSLALCHQQDQKQPPLINCLQGVTDIDEWIKQLFIEHRKPTNHNDENLRLESVWGVFCLTGFLIHDCEGQRAKQIGINIRWQIPFLLKLFYAIPKLNLTPRQQSVALFYASGCPTKVMADKLDLSIYTVKEHIHNIFERLQLRSRSELIEELLCLPAES